jgi:hypothetical protein
VREEAVDQLPLIMAAMPAAVVLTLSDLGLYDTAAAVWGVMAISLLALAGWGILLARAAHPGLAGGAFITAINVAMGLVIVILKLIVSY